MPNQPHQPHLPLRDDADDAPRETIGRIEALCIAPNRAEDLTLVEAVRAEPGKGLEGDRYWRQTGAFSKRPGPDRELTLIAAEAFDHLRAEHGIELSYGQARRNVVVGGIGCEALNELVGRRLWLGAVEIEVLQTCPPCSRLARLTQCPNLLKELWTRGGLRAQILTPGLLRVGEPVQRLPDSGADKKKA